MTSDDFNADGMEGSHRRIIIEDGLEGTVAGLVEPVVEQLGYRLVRVRLSQLNGTTLQIMAERADGTMTVEDCEAVSRALSPVLDVEDPIDREYHLEVSSPGIDRPLVRRADFEAWCHHLLKLETTRLVAGRKRFRGRILTVGADALELQRDEVQPGEEAVAVIPFEAIGDARLILTDALIEAALKADKAARKGRRDDDGTAASPGLDH